MMIGKFTIFEISKQIVRQNIVRTKRIFKIVFRHQAKHPSRFFSRYLSLQIKTDEDLLLKKEAHNSGLSV